MPALPPARVFVGSEQGKASSFDPPRPPEGTLFPLVTLFTFSLGESVNKVNIECVYIIALEHDDDRKKKWTREVCDKLIPGYEGEIIIKNAYINYLSWGMYVEDIANSDSQSKAKSICSCYVIWH